MRRYGCWAGEPKGRSEDETRCQAQVPREGRSPLYHQCARKRIHEGLCRQHAKQRDAGRHIWIPEDRP